MAHPYRSAVILAVLMVCLPALADTAQQPSPTVNIPAPSADKPAASKEDPADVLNQAIKSYQAGNLKDALKLTAQAQTDIRAKHVEVYRALLPAAPGGGWVAEEPPLSPNANLGVQLLGGISTASRSYSANGHKVTISYAADSPMLMLASAMAQMMTTPNGPTHSIDDIKGNKATYSDLPANPAQNKPPIHQIAVYDADVIVTVKSETLDKDTLLQFANIIDYDKLKAVK